jgi:hypothetical protein
MITPVDYYNQEKMKSEVQKKANLSRIMAPPGAERRGRALRGFRPAA